MYKSIKIPDNKLEIDQHINSEPAETKASNNSRYIDSYDRGEDIHLIL